MELQIVYLPPDELTPYEGNTRKHTAKDIEQIKESIKADGFNDPIGIWGDENLIVEGHGRQIAAIEMGLEKVPCIRLDHMTETQRRDYAIRHNRTAEFSEWDFGKLEEELAALAIEGIDLSGLEFEFDSAITDTTSVTDDDYEPAVPEEPKAKLGDIYQLGNHRLMCGDSTNEEDVSALMEGCKADIAFTSPPYNAGTTPTETHMGVETKYNGNDDDKTQEEYTEFLNGYLNCAINNSEYVFMNVQSLSNNKIALLDVLHEWREMYADTIIWDKGNGQPAMAHNVLNSVFEYIHVFSKKANRAIGTIDFRGTIDNVLHMPPQRKNEYSDIHNATFSVEFAGWFISRFAAETVLDQFGGTGTTLIACEELNRRCFMMELEPKYVDVIIDRWEKFTGMKAVLLNG